MRLLDRYMARELIWPFLVGVAAFTAILMGTGMLFQLARLALGGVPFLKVSRLFFLGLPSFIVLTFPMSMLFSSLMSFGRLSGESELVALFASGVSLYRMTVPVLLIALGVTAMTWEFNEQVVPWSSRAAAAIREEVGQIQTQRSVILPQYDANKNLELLVLAGGYNAAKKTLKDVKFQRYKNGNLVIFVNAPEARFSNKNTWEFRNCTVWQATPEGLIISKVDKAVYDIGHAPEEIKSSQPKPEQMTYSELQKLIAQQHRQGIRGDDVSMNEVELQRKIALPFTGLVFATVGVPLGIRPSRRSSGFGLGLGFSVLVIFAFYVLTSYLSVMGAKGLLDPVAAAWLPNLITLAFGIVLLLRAPK
jgi:lipopolysaccharide export system permease protein